MPSLDTIIKLIEDWQPLSLPNELKYRDALITFLRETLQKQSNVKVEKEYRDKGTTTDIYVKVAGFLRPTEVFIEVKRDLKQKANLDRLVGQIESLQPTKNKIMIVLCGETSPALLTRLREKYEIGMWASNVKIVVKKPAKQDKSTAVTGTPGSRRARQTKVEIGLPAANQREAIIKEMVEYFENAHIAAQKQYGANTILREPIALPNERPEDVAEAWRRFTRNHENYQRRIPERLRRV